MKKKIIWGRPISRATQNRWWDQHHGQGEVERIYIKQANRYGLGKNRETHLTQEVVRELVDYNPRTGVLRWKPRDIRWFSSYRSFRSWHAKHAGKRAFTTPRKTTTDIVYPDWPTIYASYSDELGTTANLKVQRTLELPSYRAIWEDRTRMARVAGVCRLHECYPNGFSGRGAV